MNIFNTVAFTILLFGQISGPDLSAEEVELPTASEITADSANIPATDQPDAISPLEPQTTPNSEVDASTSEQNALPTNNESGSEDADKTDANNAENADALSAPLSPAPETKKTEVKPHKNEHMIPPPILPKSNVDITNNNDPVLTPTITGAGPESQVDSQPLLQNSNSTPSVNSDLQSIDAAPSYSSVKNEEMFGTQLAPNQARGHIMPIYQAEVPAQEQGVLLKFYIQEGAVVNKNAPLVQIDDEQAQMSVQVQQAKLNAAQKEAANEVNVKYAKAARDVAEAEVQSAEETIARVPGAVPASEIRKLKLSLVQATYQIEQAKNNLEIAGYQVEVSKAELNAAKLGITKRVVRAPIPGVVVEKYRYDGEWVKPGDPIVKIVYLNKLRVKTTMDHNAMPPEKVVNHTAKVTIDQAGAPEFKGVVTFVSPIVQSGGTYEVWVDVDNSVGQGGFWILQPGMNATVTIE